MGRDPEEVEVPGDAEIPEEDALDQEIVVDEEQIRVEGELPSEAAEADWLDQSIVEPLDEDER